MKKLLLFIIGLILLGFFAHLSTKPSKPANLLAYSDQDILAYKQWCSKYNKNFADPDESVYRLEVFTDNLKKIQAHNLLNKQWSMAENQFMDLTQSEFRIKLMGLKQSKNSEDPEYIPANPNAGSIDWRQKGVVGPVKNQGMCGSCWAFSATGEMQCHTAIKSGILPSYSEQQLVDCSNDYGNYGCNGGLMDYAFEYVIDYGIESESDYPYVGRDQSCKYDESKAKKVITGYTDVPSGNCDALIEDLQKQPISVAVDATTWQFYSGGVLNDCGDQLDHGVLLVGYQEGAYWIIQNSWGTSWGERGYIRLEGPQNTCGLCNQASFTY